MEATNAKCTAFILCFLSLLTNQTLCSSGCVKERVAFNQHKLQLAKGRLGNTNIKPITVIYS